MGGRVKPSDVANPSGPDGLWIPGWFNLLYHLWARRRCRKVGHVRTLWPSCNHCGLRFADSNEQGGWAR